MPNRLLTALLLSVSLTACSSTESLVETLPERPDTPVTPTTFWTLWDSFGAQNSWQPRFAQLSGWQFSEADNKDPLHPISKGGTSSSAEVVQGSLQRARNLVALKDSRQVDVILFENVNDIHRSRAEHGPTGSVDDDPWMQRGRLSPDIVFDSEQAAEAYRRDSLASFLTSVPAAQREEVNVIDFPYHEGSEAEPRMLHAFYRGTDGSQWENPAYWTTFITLYSTYKGMFGYLQENFPEARIALVIPTYHQPHFDDPSLHNDDGTWNAEAYYSTTLQLQWKHLKEFWHEICPALGIEIINLESAAAIKLDDLERYYYPNDVHPRQEGYDLWADVLYQLLIEEK